MLKQYKKELCDFYELPPHKAKALLQNVLNVANEDKPRFIQYVRSLGFDIDSSRGIIYEAIWDKSAGWEEFALEETKLLFNLAAEAAGNREKEKEILSHTIYLIDLSTQDKGFFSDVLAFLDTQLSGPSSLIRYRALEGILELHDNDHIQLDSKIWNDMRKLLHDPNWKVRFNTFQSLQDHNKVPRDFQLSFMDRMKAKILPTLL